MSAAVTDAKQVSLRGTAYTIRELTAGEYDECIRAATNEDDEVDTVLLAKLMAMKCVEPKMTDKQLHEMPFRIWRALNRLVNEMHYTGEEEEGQGNDSDPKSDSSGS